MATQRERNNLSRRQNYAREKEKSEWSIYEDQVITRHMETYGHQVWHTSIVPETILYEAGVIHKFNKHRLLRLARKREAAGNPVKFGDYGFDAISKDLDGNFHAIQAKHYTTRKISANDLGTFFLVAMSQIQNKAYLYTSGDIEVNLSHNLANIPDKIEHIQLPFNKPTIQIQIQEKDYTLRDYQKKAITTIVNTEGKRILELPCGMGKTLICAHVLKRLNINKYVCIAPLKASIEQLMERVGAILPGYKSLLVDSNGTTDPEFIKDYLKTNTRVIIYSTFASAENVLSEVLHGDEFLVVDEVHNIVGREKLCEFVNVYENSLLMSATIPEELYDHVDAKKAYEYSMADAIKNGYIADYEVYLPLVVYDKPTDSMKISMGDIPDGLTSDMAAKALFLATGMLRTGSRRCIIYLSSCVECDEFMEVCKRVFEDYHGIDIWCNKIVQDVGAVERKEIIKAFQEDGEQEFKILASVRILDEAIDIPRCDSTFITRVGDYTSDIRTIQRIQRAGRLDPENLNKKNSCFIWASDWSKAVGCLSLLKEHDVEFHKKIKICDASYDRGDDKFYERITVDRTKELQKYVKVSCLTL